MPTYEYHCDACEHNFDEFQSINDKPLKKCPKCGNVFKAPEEEIQEVIPLLGEEPTPQPASGKKHFEDDEDTGPATYRFLDERRDSGGTIRAKPSTSCMSLG